MEKDDLQQLEQQIDDLLKVSRRTREENMLLKSQQSAWVTERAKLVERTELARSRIDKMVERLKELDNELLVPLLWLIFLVRNIKLLARKKKSLR